MNQGQYICILFIVLLLFRSKATLAQQNTLLADASWSLSQPKDSHHFIDTFSKSIWLYVDVDQGLFKEIFDSTFVITQAEVVNQSVKDVYVEGSHGRLKAAVVKETLEQSTEVNGLASHLSCALAIKTSLAFESKDYSSNPYKDLWISRNNYICIPSGTRKRLWVAMPRRENKCYFEVDYQFNSEGTVKNCQGEKIAWKQSLKSNKFMLEPTEKEY